MVFRKGFTLLEMTMAMMITVLAAMVVVPAWTNVMHEWDLEAQTRKMVAKIREVQQLAVADQKLHLITFNSVQYTVADSSYVVIEGPVAYGNGITASASFMLPMTFTLGFDQFGSPVEGGDIILTDLSSNSFTIHVEPVTGRVHIP